MITEIEVDGIGTLRHLNSYQLQRLFRIRGPNSFIAPMAFGLGMTIPQFKKLSDADRQAVVAAYSKLMAPAESDRGMIREVRPRMPEKGEHVPIDRQVWLGEQLLEVKAKLPRGHFRRWVEDHSGITWTQASRFVKLAKAKAEEAAQRDRRPSDTAEPEAATARQRSNMGRAAA